jgi:trk system potassium uptake protein TrkA
MKIIILGAGQVGATLASNLVSEDNDITVIDRDVSKLDVLQDKYDLRVIHGHAAHPSILDAAGASTADLIIAITSNDECNITACHTAYSLFKTPKKIARIRSEEYLKYSKYLFAPAANQATANLDSGYAVDEMIAPEQLVTNYIARLIEYPGALQVLEFGKSSVSLIAVRAYYGGPLVGSALSSLREHMPHVDTRVAAIFRHGRPIMPRGTTMIEADDEVFFIADSRHIREVIAEVQKQDHHYNNIMIAGGGNIGFGLAEKLEHNHIVKLIERNPDRAEIISKRLANTTVFCGDASDHELLLEEHIDQVDVFIAVTNDDEVNIMSALLTKKLGAKKVMVLIQREAYTDLIQDAKIDVAISPQQATISAILTHIRQGDICNVYSLRRGAAEAIEIIARGTKETSKIVGRQISHIKLPPGVTIGAVIRDDEVLIAHDKTIIDTDDHVIMFLVDKKFINEVEKLFQLSAVIF